MFLRKKEGQEMNVLKPFKRTTVYTLIHNGISQHEIFRKTGIDRKTIRKYQGLLGPPSAADPNSPMATGFVNQNRPEGGGWPPAFIGLAAGPPGQSTIPKH